MSRAECWLYGLFAAVVVAWISALCYESEARYGGPDLHRPAPSCYPR